LALARHYFLTIHHLRGIPEKSVLCLNAASIDPRTPLHGPDQYLHTLFHSKHPTHSHLLRFVIIDEVEQIPLETQWYLRTMFQEQSPTSMIRFFCMSNSYCELAGLGLGALCIRVVPPTRQQLQQALWSIVQQEHQEKLFDGDANHDRLQQVIQESNHDFRRAIHELQTICCAAAAIPTAPTSLRSKRGKRGGGEGGG
jgi:hypothetical protein